LASHLRRANGICSDLLLIRSWGMTVDIVGRITDTQVIATGRRIRELARLQKSYGVARWRKLKGIASVRLDDGSRARAEVHWYEAACIGKREMKIKRFVQ
jgi:hypothetical protein